MDKIKSNTVVPPLGTMVDSNPQMYCNFAREEPNENRCLNCKESNCKHCGETKDNAL